MKSHAITLSLLLAVLVSLSIGPDSRASMQSQGSDEPAAPAVAEDVEPVPAGGATPLRPLPSRPIPHHEPGHLAKAVDYTTQVSRVNPDGVQETVQLTGLEALLADNVAADPLEGNYRLVTLDKLMWGSYHYWDGSNKLALQTYGLVTPTLTTVPGSWTVPGNYRFYDITAGDLNADRQDEQITAWIGAENRIYLSIGEMPGSLGRVTSGPALLPSNGARHLFARGYDDALWHHNGEWWQNLGNRLLSAPAVVSRAEGEFDAFCPGPG
jgi:hypothetical protein